jgi:hypothetical protein
MLIKGLKIIIDKPDNSQNVSDIKVLHTSIKSVLHTTFTVRGMSKYLFDIKTMTSIGIEKLKVTIL